MLPPQFFTYLWENKLYLPITKNKGDPNKVRIFIFLMG